MKLRDLKNGKIELKMHGRYPAAYIARTKKKHALTRKKRR